MSKKSSLPSERTKAYSLLQAIAISGELPIAQAKRLVGGGRYYEKVITSLNANNLISPYNKGQLYGYRLTYSAKCRLIAENAGRFEYYLSGKTGTNHVRVEHVHRLRLYCVAEVYVSMMNSGVALYLDEKPDVFYPHGVDPPDLRSMLSPAFYSSREIKDMGIDSPGIRGSRAVGILLTPENLLITYNAIGGLLKVDYKPEMRLKALARTTICGQRLGHQYTPDNIRGLLFGTDMALAGKLLCESQGKDRNYFIFDGGYDHFHYLTHDPQGEAILKILCDPARHRMLTRILSIGFHARDSGSMFENDATDASGRPVLFAVDCDLPRIGRFKRALLTHDIVGTLLCFDFQADALRLFCGDLAVIKSIDFVKFAGRYLS